MTFIDYNNHPELEKTPVLDYNVFDPKITVIPTIEEIKENTPNPNSGNIEDSYIKIKKEAADIVKINTYEEESKQLPITGSAVIKHKLKNPVDNTPHRPVVYDNEVYNLQPDPNANDVYDINIPDPNQVDDQVNNQVNNQANENDDQANENDDQANENDDQDDNISSGTDSEEDDEGIENEGGEIANENNEMDSDRDDDDRDDNRMDDRDDDDRDDNRMDDRDDNRNENLNINIPPELLTELGVQNIDELVQINQAVLNQVQNE